MATDTQISAERRVISNEQTKRYRRIYPDYVSDNSRGGDCMITVGITILLWILCYKKKSMRDDEEQEEFLKNRK